MPENVVNGRSLNQGDLHGPACLVSQLEYAVVWRCLTQLHPACLLEPYLGDDENIQPVVMYDDMELHRLVYSQTSIDKADI